MIDDHTTELIQAGVDGELDESGQAELRKVLDESEEARHYHSELSRLADFLDKIPDHDLPDGLHARITQDIPLPSGSPIKSLFSFSAMPGFIRYGFAAAAGLVLAVAIYENREELQDPNDIASMVGTMTRGGPQGLRRELDSWSFETGQASGEVSLQRRNGSLVLELQMESASPLDFSIDFSGNGLELDAFANVESALESIQYADSVLHGTGTGAQRFVILLHRADSVEAGVGQADKGPRIGLEFIQQGEAIHSGWLEPGG